MAQPDAIARAACLFYLTSAVTFCGLFFGAEFVRLPPGQPDKDFVASLANWDGNWYSGIAIDGYHYNPEKGSNVAYFPVFPLLVRLVLQFGVRPEVALVVISNAFFFGSIVVGSQYAQHRLVEDRERVLALLGIGLFPAALFFHLGYSESVFLFCCIALFLLMEYRQNIWLVAGVCGLITAIRPVGVAALAPTLLYCWHRRRCWLTSLILMPIALWGLLAYIAFQAYQFGEPLAFAKTQTYWQMRPAPDFGSVLVSLLQLRPIWGQYVEGSPFYWADKVEFVSLFHIQFANPIYFVMICVLVGVGAARRWLNSYEVFFAIGLIAIPYFTRAFEMCMASQGRFVSVVFPAFIVLARLLSVSPYGVGLLWLTVSGVLQLLYAALFAAGYLII